MKQKSSWAGQPSALEWPILFLSFCMLLLLWSSTWHRISIEEQIEKRDAIRAGATYSRAFADHVQHTVRQIDNSLKLVRQNHNRLQGQPDASVMQLDLLYQGFVSSLAVADETGRVTASYLGLERRTFVGAENFFRYHQQQRSDGLYSEPPVGEERQLTWSRGIYDRDGNFRGVVFATSPAQELTDFLWEMELEGDSVLVVVGLDGVLRASEPVEAVGGKQDAIGKLLVQQAAIQPFAQVGFAQENQGLERVFHYHSLEKYPLIVAVGVDVQQIKAAMNERKHFYRVVAVGGSIFISVVCAWLVRRLRKEDRLKRQVEDFARQIASLQMITGHLVQDREEVGDLLKTIITDAVQLMGAPDGYISVVNESNKLEVKYAIGFYSELPRREIERGEGASGEVLVFGKMLHVPDYQKLPCKLPDPEMSQVSTMLLYPLNSGGRMLGIFGISWRNEQFVPNEEQLGLLEQYAFLAAIALEKVQVKVRLREELQRSEEQQIDLQMAWRMLEESNRKLRLANEHLEEVALTDRLTGAWNRRKFEETAEQEMLRSQRYREAVSILLIDIDFFKQINDEHGHLLGDQVLVEVVDRIQQNLRVVDSIYRWGGEEFAVLLPCSTGEAAVAAAEKLRREMTNKPMSSLQLILTVSIGVAEFMSEDTLESWLKRADDALYQAKKSGRNKVVLF
ncbi:MAG: diguanylate cyclase [Anaeromusa sp.]|uniref:diguanylate cyclase n=1 Tax=Anaeromusa sp. TaxID=1872520 RepID=UPI002B21360A|nr:diguanylate cyclase [Anaeromusa sp.]MEA4835295.1 diguanylate cyclase [Anaeromusa sp.]